MNTAVFVNPITKQIEQMPVEMIAAYVPFADHLPLELAARVAAIRDDEAARNLELSCLDTEYQALTLADATGFDYLAVEPPSLR